MGNEVHSKELQQDCAECSVADKTVAGGPNVPLRGLIEVANKSNENDLKDNYQIQFCDKFSMIEWESVGTTLKEMEATPYPVDTYFQMASCQPSNYNSSVKAPIFHLIADNPSKREKFLNILWLYYSRKKNDPVGFTKNLNAKNTKGETLLDYIESMKKNDMYPTLAFQTSISKIISMVCSRGGVYSVYSNMRCP